MLTIGSLRFHAGSLDGAPHVLGVVATRVAHRDADQHGPPALGEVQEAGQRARVLELIGVIDRQRHRGRTGHRQTDGRVAARIDALVGGQVGGQLLGEERLPLVGAAAGLAACGLVPVAVEAGLAAHGHDHCETGVDVPLERRGVDVPTVEVVLRTQTVEQVDAGGPRAAALELDLDVLAHTGGRHHQVLHRQTGTREGPRSRRAADRADQAWHHGCRKGGHREPAPQVSLRHAASGTNFMLVCFPSVVGQQQAPDPGMPPGPGHVARVVNHTFVVFSLPGSARS